ncbi:hypothetical protein Hanom_Chr12g01114541 [Helianthus anomalus]
MMHFSHVLFFLRASISVSIAFFHSSDFKASCVGIPSGYLCCNWFNLFNDWFNLLNLFNIWINMFCMLCCCRFCGFPCCLIVIRRRTFRVFSISYLWYHVGWTIFSGTVLLRLYSCV